jgi:hypothetical protein
MSYKQCINGHYYAFGVACPFCGAAESQESREGAIDYGQTAKECPNCGGFSPVRQRRCIYCGADLCEPHTQSETRTRPEYTPEHITQLAPNEIFVFGSNLDGIHGGGAPDMPTSILARSGESV